MTRRSWPADIKVAVNLSPVQFKQAELFDVIQSALSKSGLRRSGSRSRSPNPCCWNSAAENQSFIDRS